MIRILIIEDERLFRESLVRRVEQFEDCQVVSTATNGIEGLLEATTLQPDVIFSDIRMPGMNGIHFLEQLRKDCSQTLVVFISGFPEFENLRRALQLNAFDYLTKPLEDHDLLQVITRIRTFMIEQNSVMEDLVEDDNEKYQMWIDKIKYWIQIHLNHVSLLKAAEHADMNPTAFSRKFSELAGITFIQYITKLRIDKAKEMLADPRTKINEIAVELGLFDQRYFSEMFKKHIGCSPQEYRKKRQ